MVNGHFMRLFPYEATGLYAFLCVNVIKLRILNELQVKSNIIKLNLIRKWEYAWDQSRKQRSKKQRDGIASKNLHFVNAIYI